jgi:hypothetical protein
VYYGEVAFLELATGAITKEADPAKQAAALTSGQQAYEMVRNGFGLQLYNG